MSDRNSTCSSERPFSILSGPTSANGTRAYSACPPAKPPVRCEDPNAHDPDCPSPFSASAALGFEFSHNDQLSCRHCQHSPQAIVNGTTTRSPTFSVLTLAPTSTTSPMNSCPRTSPFFIGWTNPLYRCRSEPQIAVEVMRTIASDWFRICGSGTSCTSTLCFPIQQAAFIAVPP